jgi:hypothetical protein
VWRAHTKTSSLPKWNFEITISDSYCPYPFAIDLFCGLANMGTVRSRTNPFHDGLLVAARKPPLGSHVVTPRRGYLHHGIYVGDGKVVHYAGLRYGRHRGPVEEVSLACFSRGRPTRVRSIGPSCFDYREVIRRARSRIGEDRYRLLTNNCEHFCEWCLSGEHRSHQVEAWLSRPVGRALHATIRFVAKLRQPQGKRVGEP